MKILFLGDVVGRKGRNAVKEFLPEFKERNRVDIVVVNGENSAGGYGINDKIISDFFKWGVDVITSGNHIFDQKKYLYLLEEEKRLLRPINYPDTVKGKGFYLLEKDNVKVLIVSAQGRVFMDNIDCPFQKLSEFVEKYSKITKNIFIDFHAEATAEKQALGFFLDGKVTAIVGTHTHVQTSDERLLPKGTAFLTDLGMCGSFNSVIGMDIEKAVKRLIDGIGYRLEPEKENVWVNGALIEFDESIGVAGKITRINQKIFE